MPFQRPTLSQISDRVQQDFVSRLQLPGAALRRSIVVVLSRVIAGTTHLLYGFLDYLSRQMFADQAEDEFLLRWANLYGITPEGATFATATVTLTGTDGSIVSAGHVLTRSDGAEYTTDADATIASGSAPVNVTASVAGADGSLDVGMSLSFAAPVDAVDASAVVATVLTDGSDIEDPEAVRSRLLGRLRNAPQGGAASDYEAWAKQVGGVTRVWVIPLGLGPGTVLVYFMRDNDSGSPFPDGGEVAVVQAYLDGLRPVTAAVTAAAPTNSAVNYSLHITPDTSASRAAVTASLDDLHAREASPEAEALKLSHIRTAIGDALSQYGASSDYTLASPSADVTPSLGQLPTRGTITFT